MAELEISSLSFLRYYQAVVKMLANKIGICISVQLLILI